MYQPGGSEDDNTDSQTYIAGLIGPHFAHPSSLARHTTPTSNGPSEMADNSVSRQELNVDNQGGKSLSFISVIVANL